MRTLVLTYSIIGSMLLPTLYKIANEWAINFHGQELVNTWGQEMGKRPPYPFGYLFFFVAIPLAVIITLKHFLFDRKHAVTLITLLIYRAYFGSLLIFFGINIYYIVQALIFSILFTVLNVYANHEDDISYFTAVRLDSTKNRKRLVLSPFFW